MNAPEGSVVLDVDGLNVDIATADQIPSAVSWA